MSVGRRHRRPGDLVDGARQVVLTLRTAAMASALVWQHHEVQPGKPAATAADQRWTRELGLVHELELMRQIASQLASTLDPESALAELALAAARIAAPAPSRLGQAVVLRARIDAVDVVASVGAASGQFARALRRATGDVLRSGLPVRFTLEEVASATERQHLAEAGIGAVALAPIPGAGERYGVLAAGFPDGRPVATDELRRLALLADLGGLAVASTTAYRREHRALETSQERLRELGLLNDATRVFSATLDVDEIEREIVRTAARLVAPDDSSGRGAAFFRVDGSTAALAHAEGYRAGPARAGQFPVDSCPELAGALSGRRAVGAAHVAMAPVLVKDRPHGVVSVSRQDGRGFDGDVLRQLEGIASLAGLAIANAQHFEAVRREGARMAALEDAKSKFLRLASHELRSPIAVLRGYLSMLSDGTFDGRREEIAEVYEMMDAKVRQMELLVGQMLDAARLEEGRLRVDLARLDLRRPVEDAVESARPMVTARHDLRVAMPDHPVEVVADAWRVTTIVANLLGNGIKYSPDGGPVSCVLRVEDGSAVVEVADSGLGIAEADMATLFARFGRIVTPENSHIPGTGLGLHLSRELAQMQGGELGVTSAAGAGSTFTLTLPLAGPPAAERSAAG